MSVSDYISIAAILVSFIVSIISIIIASQTLKANHKIVEANHEMVESNYKMIESTTRPYVLPSYDGFRVTPLKTFFAIKNYGPSGARIIDFDYTIKADQPYDEKYFLHLKTLKDFFIAPSQTKFFHMDGVEIHKINSITFDFSYESTIGKIYNEHITISTKILPLWRTTEPGKSTPKNQHVLYRQNNVLEEILKHIY